MAPPPSLIGGVVHPRVCGGARRVLRTDGTCWGPSPRVRGSLIDQALEVLWQGSIPACAGEPIRSSFRDASTRVHPRVCGGAVSFADEDQPYGGPSPRVRGSPRVQDGGLSCAGSIPACAGEPIARGIGRAPCRVHPRVCGGAGRYQSVPDLGSIPACAGEPRSRTPASSRSGVHPRVCGGAAREKHETPGHLGPSPRVRGSRSTSPISMVIIGSIPACAGEPSFFSTTSYGRRVHPRVCGGSRPQPERIRHLSGSIPACAGEPCPSTRTYAPVGVHPRVCGGAFEAPTFTLAAHGPSPRVRGSPDHRGGCHRRDGSIPACAGEPTRS